MSSHPDPPSAHQECTVCGVLIAGTEVAWISEHPRRAHEGCIDWTTRAYPYAPRVTTLRRLYRSLRGDSRARVARTGRWLLAAETVWPLGAPAVLAETRARLSRLRRDLEELGVPANDLRGLP